jgi:uridine kinase
MDTFQKPRAQRLAPGADSAETYYRDTFDYELFRRVLVQPFKLGGSTGFVTAAFDAERDAQIEMDWKTGPQDATLIVDGAFLNRAELRGLWNFSIWLEVADATEQALYATEAKPREHATAIMDISDPEHPRRLFADSC